MPLCVRMVPGGNGFRQGTTAGIDNGPPIPRLPYLFYSAVGALPLDSGEQTMQNLTLLHPRMYNAAMTAIRKQRAAEGADKGSGGIVPPLSYRGA